MRKIVINHGVFTLKTFKRLMLSLTIVIIFDFFFFPFPILANESAVIPGKDKEVSVSEADIGKEIPMVFSNFPENSELAVKWGGRFVVTAYNSEVEQCDATPCITASGFDVCRHGVEDTVAVNFLKFGTKIKIPELYGDRVFVVRDRMNKKYDQRIDIWMVEKSDAINFGKHYVKIEVLDHDH